MSSTRVHSSSSADTHYSNCVNTDSMGGRISLLEEIKNFHPLVFSSYPLLFFPILITEPALTLTKFFGVVHTLNDTGYLDGTLLNQVFGQRQNEKKKMRIQNLRDR